MPPAGPRGTAGGARLTAAATGGGPGTDPGFRCAAASVLRDEVVGGTASTVRAWILLECPGPWGVDALRDARLPEGLGALLRRRTAETGVRFVLVRRPGARRLEADPWVFAAYADPHRPRLEGGQVTDLRQVLDLDLTGLRAGRPSGLPAYDGSLLAVCTHGRHDACCAERGRPVARALAQAHPDETWEVSHVGGDRFAANMVVLPHGLYYGRLEPRSALAVAAAHASGRLDLDHLRGRSGYPMPVQAAEIALRRRLEETGLDSVRLRRRTVADTGGDTGEDVGEGRVTRVEMEVAGATYAVRVRTTSGPDAAQLTCRASRENPLPHHQLLDVRRLD